MQGTTEPGATQLYVKKWMKSRHAILFQLSNKLVLCGGDMLYWCSTCATTESFNGSLVSSCYNRILF